MGKGDQDNNAPGEDFGLWRPSRAMGLARALQKAGYGTRKQMITLVGEGHVKVDDETTVDPLFAVGPDSTITLYGKPLTVSERSYYAIHKPARVVCSSPDGGSRPLLEEFYPRNISGLVTAGRMDGKTAGLMLLSNDTTWNTCFTECTDMEQEYRIQFQGELTSLELELIKAGVQLSSGGIFKPSSISVVEVLNGCTVLNMVAVGKIRLVRQLLKSLEHQVIYLRRLRLGIIRLGTLPVGTCRRLTDPEIQFIKDCSPVVVDDNNAEEDQ